MEAKMDLVRGSAGRGHTWWSRGLFFFVLFCLKLPSKTVLKTQLRERQMQAKR